MINEHKTFRRSYYSGALFQITCRGATLSSSSREISLWHYRMVCLVHYKYVSYVVQGWYGVSFRG
jgi:hypothetical protein